MSNKQKIGKCVNQENNHQNWSTHAKCACRSLYTPESAVALRCVVVVCTVRVDVKKLINKDCDVVQVSVVRVKLINWC